MAILPGNYKAVILRQMVSWLRMRSVTGTPAKSLIPDKYSSSDDTDVTVTVSPSGGEVNIQLRANRPRELG